MDMSNKDAIKNKVRALMAKTVENGCTEDEAMAAADAVSRLMLKYSLELSDLEISSGKCKRTDLHTTREENYIRWVVVALANLAGVRAVMASRSNVGFVKLDNGRQKYMKYEECIFTFFGFPEDVEFALYLSAIVLQALRSGSVEYDAAGKDGRKKRSFMYGMAVSMSNKLWLMAKQRENEAKADRNSRALVVIDNKRAVVTQQFEEAFSRIGKAKKKNIKITDAYFEGRERGEKVEFNRGIGHNEGKRLGGS